MFKLQQSVVNVMATFLIATVVLPGSYMDFAQLKLSCVLVFFFYNIYFESRYGRCLGMMWGKTHYANPCDTSKKMWYILFYTLSFSTLLYYVWFPFDLLLINFLCLQLPCLLIKGNTLHGYLGGMETVFRKRLLRKRPAQA